MFSTDVESMCAYQSLDHEHSLGPHVTEELVHVDRALLLHPLQHAVQENEGAGPTHPRTAVDQHWRAILDVCLTNATDKGNERGGKLGYTVVGPAQEVIVGYY